MAVALRGDRGSQPPFPGAWDRPVAVAVALRGDRGSQRRVDTVGHVQGHRVADAPPRRERRVIKLRHLNRWGPARITGHRGMHASTVHRILTRYRCARLAHTDRATGRTVRRYERARPGELVHVDIKKLGNIPDGGGHKVLGRPQGCKHRTKAGYAYLHNAVDDHSRLAYSEILADEAKETATGFWERAHAYFASLGITVERVLTDNGSCYKSHTWRDLLRGQGVKHKRTRPYRPPTNGKVERFNRILVEEWAYARPYTSEAERREAFGQWLHHYKHHRFHTALSGPHATRVPNLSVQYN